MLLDKFPRSARGGAGAADWYYITASFIHYILIFLQLYFSMCKAEYVSPGPDEWKVIFLF